MALLGNAVLAIWNDVQEEGHADFVAWHSREHFPERLGIAGFRRGRRLRASYGTSGYFTLYEIDSLAVLASSFYAERLNNPTPETRRVTGAYFRNIVRGACDVAATGGAGIGGAMATLRFAVPDQQAERIRRDLVAKILPRMQRAPSVVAAHFCIADKSGTGQFTRRKVETSAPAWVVMIEASEAPAADRVADSLLAEPALSAARVDLRCGLYLLEHSLRADELQSKGA